MPAGTVVARADVLEVMSGAQADHPKQEIV
ncbi:hypothetical protein SAMN04490357_2863 [Streptomyces misionensis]|uniref:Uncharacterized protein n=1 Tax=Streptomyces misionensis TaxID=67331 RepID=A0A1H4V9Z3_9ACTN|nr:hypothetical protein SAMN04490357_2863 [Streptomyces misionensis]SFY51848.1 hypothetical protein STEPF1_05115 [Streptomyces sp. F-1]